MSSEEGMVRESGGGGASLIASLHKGDAGLLLDSGAPQILIPRAVVFLYNPPFQFFQVVLLFHLSPLSALCHQGKTPASLSSG